MSSCMCGCLSARPRTPNTAQLCTHPHAHRIPISSSAHSLRLSSASSRSSPHQCLPPPPSSPLPHGDVGANRSPLRRWPTALCADSLPHCHASTQRPPCSLSPAALVLPPLLSLQPLRLRWEPSELTGSRYRQSALLPFLPSPASSPPPLTSPLGAAVRLLRRVGSLTPGCWPHGIRLRITTSCTPCCSPPLPSCPTRTRGPRACWPLA